MRLVLHAGLHRAGSSSIQSVLQDLNEPLARQRILAVTQTMANAPEHRAFKLLRGHKVAELGLAVVRDRLNAHFAALKADYDAIVFSDENMPGFMPGKRQAAFAHVDALAALISALRRDHVVKVAMVLREHVGYLRSVHNFRLARSESGDFATFAGGLDLDSIAFAPMLEAIAKAVGTENLNVHGFEDLGGGQGALQAMGQMADAPLLADASLPRANTSRNAVQLAFFRALNAGGVFVPLRAPRQRLTEVINSMPEFPNCDDAALERLLELLRRDACRLPFAISSEDRLRAAVKLHGTGGGRLLPGVSRAKLRDLLRQCATFVESSQTSSADDVAFSATLWGRFAVDREKTANAWLPQWAKLTAPVGS